MTSQTAPSAHSAARGWHHSVLSWCGALDVPVRMCVRAARVRIYCTLCRVSPLAAIGRTGAVAPLCNLVREGSEEAKDRSASAIWSLATDHAQNKDTIAKLGGMDPLLGLLVTGYTDRSQINTSGALCALAAKNLDNRALIAKRLVGLLGSAAAKAPERAVRVLMACSSFANDSTANQIAIAKTGGIPPLIEWLASLAPNAQAQAAQTLLCLAIDNQTTQALIAKSAGIPPLIQLVKRSSRSAQEYAARALWHLASQLENRADAPRTSRTGHGHFLGYDAPILPRSLLRGHCSSVAAPPTPQRTHVRTQYAHNTHTIRKLLTRRSRGLPRPQSSSLSRALGSGLSSACFPSRGSRQPSWRRSTSCAYRAPPRTLLCTSPRREVSRHSSNCSLTIVPPTRREHSTRL